MASTGSGLAGFWEKADETWVGSRCVAAQNRHSRGKYEVVGRSDGPVSRDSFVFFSISYGFEITDCDLKSHAKSCHAAQRSAQRNRCVPEHRDYEGIRAAATRGDS